MNGPPATRRTVLTAIGGAVLALAVRPAQATPETMKSAIRQVIGEAAVKLGRIKSPCRRSLRTATRWRWRCRSTAR
jgi:sulfur-oxidizing protein SoxY